MRSYETIVIIKPDLAGEEVEKIYKNTLDYLEKSNCQIIKEENWGKRKLAYEIDKYKEGIYYYFRYNSINYNIPKELEKSFNLNESILRYISVKLYEKKSTKNDRQVNEPSSMKIDTDQHKETASSVEEEKTEFEG
jgi:small subunit ribosomal protein S6